MSAYRRILDSLGYSESQIEEAITDMYNDGELLIDEKRLDVAVTAELLMARRRAFSAQTLDSDEDSDTSIDSDW